MPRLLQAIGRDVASALRGLARSPRFATLSLLAWALGIGSATALFTLVDDALLDPLPYRDADRLVVVWERHPERGLERIPAAPAKFRDWEGEEGLFEAMALFRQDAMDLTGRGDPRRLEVGRVLPRIFPLLGVEAARGRLPTPGEAVPGRDAVVVLTHDFWVGTMGSDPGILGTSLLLDGRPHTVVGILEPGPALPTDVELYAPLALENWASRAAHAYRAVARLAPGVTVEGAREAMGAVAARLAAEHPETDAGFDATVEPLRDALMGEGLGRSVLLLQGAGLLLLLLASANAGTLVLVRTLERRRELAVRTALGAPRCGLVRGVVAESLVLAAVGGAVGVAAAALAVDALLGSGILPLPPVPSPGLDGSGVTFAGAVALVMGLVSGAVPGLRGTRADPADVLRGGGSTDPPGGARLRRALVAGEIALATLLVLGSVLLVRSLDALRAVDPGFETRERVALELRLPMERYPDPDARSGFYREVADAVVAVPGVRDAALVSHLPLTPRSDRFRFQIEGSPPDRFADLLVAEVRTVSPGYLGLMGIPVERGRGIDPGDDAGAEPVALVNEAMARRFWPDGDPLRARVSFSGDEGPWVRIVGVVGDVRHHGPHTEPVPEVYQPLEQEPWPAAWLVVHAPGGGAGVTHGVREALGRVDPALAPGPVRSLDDLLAGARGPWTVQAALVGAFGALALLLAALGVHGLMGYLVEARRRELGVRRALGARDAHVRVEVARELAWVAFPAVTAGLGGGALLSGVVEGFLFGVGGLDPWSYAGAALLLAAAASGAAWRPLRRALATDPARILREG